MRAVSILLLCVSAVGAEAIRFATQPALSPDGKTLVFSWRGDIWRASSGGGAATRLTTHPAADTNPQFSPDGNSIAFNSNRAGADQVFVMDLENRRPRQLTYHSDGSSLSDWLPDGQTTLVAG